MSIAVDSISCVIDTDNPKRRMYKAVLPIQDGTDPAPGANPFLSSSFRSLLDSLDASHIVVGRTTPDWHGVVLVVNGVNADWRDRHHRVVSLLVGQLDANPATIGVDLSYRPLAAGINRQLAATN
jgi:hypothetical protein